MICCIKLFKLKEVLRNTTGMTPVLTVDKDQTDTIVEAFRTALEQKFGKHLLFTAINFFN